MKVLQSQAILLPCTSFPLKESTNVEIQSPINTITNVNLNNEDNVTTVKLTTTPTKNIVLDLSTPSTSKDKPHFNKSINEYLQNPPVSKRKFIRKTEKNPYLITSENFRATTERREIEKQQKENEKIERKRKRDEQAATRKQNSIEKRKKGKGVGKTSINETTKKETETVTPLNDIERSTSNVETVNKNVLSESTNKIKILHNMLLITCKSCRRLALKSKSLLCSSCKKSYHNQCIPIKHREHIPDEEDILDFICHNCYIMNDDSEDEVSNNMY
ncbi:unnamed protein product [Parnassius apollo]|uniref:(apollo) hypothetical protein n=1 Tax=Parnassius apollo TaxID=110799 RepID=A0A8S3WJQ3_PARAO|nr:unnamed protein product [Parnassius apollo]